MRIIETVQVLKRKISLHGAKGVLLNDVISEVIGEGEEISWLLIIFIIRRYLSKHDYKFKLTDNQPIDIDSLNDEDLLHHRDNLICVATSVDIHRAFGIETSVDIQQPGSTNESVLDMVVRSGPKGCLISDTAKLGSGVSTGNHIDRLVSTGLLQKRTIMPLKNVASKRAMCRSVIVHSKLFSKAYNAASDGVKIMVHKTYLEQIVKEIAMIMDRNSINCLPVADLSGLMGLTSTDMYNIRKAVTSLNNKEFCGLHFSFKLCNPFYRGSSLRPACRARCISRVNSDTNQVDYTNFKARRNLPVLESIAVTLDLVQDGLTSDQLRKIIPCNNFKRANKLFFDFNKIFSYPLEKIQDGKQLKYRLMSKNSVDASTANVDKSTAAKGDGSRVKPSRSSVDDKIEDSTTSAIVHDDGDDDDERHTSDPPANAKKTGGSSSSRKRVSMKETNGGLVSLQQQWNCKIVMDYLNKDEIGGICSVLDIVIEIRKQHIESGQTHICDKRTIIRVLDRLEQVEGKITRFEVPDPRGSKPPLVVVVLIDLKVTDDIVNAFLDRLIIKSKPPIESIDKKRQHDEEGDDGFDLDENTHSTHTSKRRKKRVVKLDDPELFATVISDASDLIPVNPPGFCVSCMLLHHYLLEYLQRDHKITTGSGSSSSSKSSVSSSICVNMTDMLLDLPLMYLWKTDRVLSTEEHADFLISCPEYAKMFRDSLNDGSTLRQFLPKESSFETKPLLSFMTNTFMRFEQSKRLCFLVSVGILKLVDLLPVKTFLSAFQSGVIRNIMSDISDNVDELIVSDGVGIYGTNKLQMYLWAKFFEYLSTCEDGSSSDSTEVHALVDFLFSSKYQVNIIPVGSRSKVCSSTDIYNHWKTIVLPALSFRWDDVDMQWLSLIGLQALYHSFVIGTCSHLNKESFNRTNLKGTAMMHLTTVAAWGETNITTAWKDILVLSWKHLSVGYSSMPEDKDIKCMQIESSDIPCEDSKHKEIRELLPIPDQGVESVESIEVQQRADEIDDINDVAMDELTALIDIQSPPMNNCFSLGNDLVRDLKSCLIPCEDDLSSRQIAILLEVLVICYLVKYRSGVYQSLSKEAKDTLRLVESEFVDPASTCLDVDLQYTDFSMVPDAHISNTLSKLVVRKNIIRNRVSQCLRAMPALNELVGWVICRKGSALSHTFIDQMNHVLESRTISTVNARRKKNIHKALSLIIQSCFETFANKKQIILLLQERYEKEHVKAAYRELLARGLIRRRKVCDYPGCHPGKTSRCKHKNYETTQLFIDMFSFSLAPFYAKLLKDSRKSNASVVPKVGPTFFHRLAAKSQLSSSFVNIVPANIAYICNVMSSAVEEIQSGIDVSSSAVDGTSSSHISSSIDLLTEGRGVTAASSLLELLPKKELFLSSTTTFCQRPLNSIKVQLLQVETTGCDLTSRANHEDVQAEEAPSQTLHAPWRMFNGTLNHVLFEQFAAKTLAIITERPGTTFRHIHTHLQILSESQSLELLTLLSERRLIMHSYSAKEVIVQNPFDVYMKFTNTVDKRMSLQDNIQDRCYFLRMDS